MAEALRPIVKFRKYKMMDIAGIREFYSLLKATIESVKTVGYVKLLINNQTIPYILGKMPHTD